MEIKVLGPGCCRCKTTYQVIEKVRQAPEPMLSENIIKSQIIDNHILSTMQSKSKSF